jgi:hypothetical protein
MGNPRSPSIYKPDQNTDGVTPQDIIDKAIENRHIGDNEINLAKLSNEVLVLLEKVANRITVATDGGNFETLSAAMASITDASIANPYVIDIFPGVYNEPNPIICKAFITVQAHGVVIINAQNASQNILELERSSFIYGLTLQGATSGRAIYKKSSFIYGLTLQGATSGRAIYKNTIGNSVVSDITIIDCQTNVCIDNAGGLLFAEDITLLGISSSINRGIEILAGNVNFSNINLALTGIQTCTDFFYLFNSTSIVTVDGVSSFSSNLVNGIHTVNNPNCVFRNVSLVGMNTGILIDGQTSIRFFNTVIFDAQAYAFHVTSTPGQSLVGIYSSEFRTSATYDMFIECTDCEIFGSGLTTDSSNISIVAGASLHLSFTDLFRGDEGTNILGELKVGSPIDPTESVFGEGDSHVNMLVYTKTDANVFTDVSTEAKSIEGSTFTFPGIGANNAIYIANKYNNGLNNLKHHGIKYLTTIAANVGAGEIVLEYWNGASWIEFNGMVTDGSLPFLPYAKQYFEGLGSFQLRYDPLMVNDSWVANDPMSLGENYFWVRARIKTAITTAPTFEQFKVHSSRSEKNGDGFDEFFGNARPALQLPVNIGSAKPFEGAMQNQTVYIDQDLGVGYQVNKFTATADKLGFSFTIPNNIDTSAPITLRWTGLFSTSHTPEWTVRWGRTNPGDTIYTTEPGGGSNPSTQSTTVSKAVTLNQQEWFEVTLDVSEFIARRDVDFPDFMVISLQPTTLSGTFSIMDIQAYYFIWGIGGHAD